MIHAYNVCISIINMKFGRHFEGWGLMIKSSKRILNHYKKKEKKRWTYSFRDSNGGPLKK